MTFWILVSAAKLEVTSHALRETTEFALWRFILHKKILKLKQELNWKKFISMRDFKSIRSFFALVFILLIIFSGGVIESVPFAILSTEVVSKGASQAVVGLIMGSFNFSRSLCTIPLLTIITPNKTRWSFILGALVVGLCCAIFGELARFRSTTPFVLSCIITRFIMGVGVSLIWASMTSLALICYSDHVGTILALLQMFLAVWDLAGPPVASLLFDVGGYSLPFIVTGVLQCFLLISYSIVSLEQQETSQISEDSRGTVRMTILKFIFCPGILINSLPAFMVSIFMGFLSSAYTSYLRDAFGVGQSTAGIYFLPYTSGASLSVLFFGKMVDKGCSGLFLCIGTVGVKLKWCIILELKKEIISVLFRQIYSHK